MSNIQKGKELIAILRKIEIRLSLLKKKSKIWQLMVWNVLDNTQVLVHTA